MNEKQKSAIIEMKINEATFDNCAIEPSYINFFFGNNGVGKTTISRIINSCRKPVNESPNPYDKNPSVIFKDGKYPNDYNILVFNRDFIESNIQQLGSLPGVFTMNETNIAIQKQIEELQDKNERLISENRELEKNTILKQQEKYKLQEEFKDTCWEKTESIRNAFPETQSGVKRDKKKFLDKILNINKPVPHELSTIKSLYNTAFDPNSRTYPLLSDISNTNALDAFEEISLMERSITSSSDSEFTKFIKTINALDWIKQGHDQFQNTPDNKCPYCQQKLPDNFEIKLAECFDKQYQTDIEHLKSLLSTYTLVANNIFVPLQNNNKDVFPYIDYTEYNDKLAILHTVIDNNIQCIKSKINEPGSKISLKPTALLMEELNSIIVSYNTKIAEYNAIIASKHRSQDKCSTEVFELLAETLKDDIKRYKEKKVAIDIGIEKANNTIRKNRSESNDLKLQITNLNSKIRNTSDTVNKMNKLLTDSGFQGFRIREKAKFKNMYEVVREDDDVAKMLSEGEINFIAFLYFYCLVHGNGNIGDALVMTNKFGEDKLLSDGSDSRDKIVVIDDPVSSMDSSSLFIVSSLVREMISICQNNVSSDDNEQHKYTYIKQIFILTHNAYFHREVTANQERHYRYVSFYLITKTNNKSTIKLCTRKKAIAPTDIENYNPVQNSYAALWTEYKELSTAIPLMNVMRRILEYYFIQICGYNGTSIQDIILKDHKNNFIRKNTITSTEDTTYYQIALSLLMYICSNSFGINDGLYYVDDCINIEQCKETFKMIFDYMGQAQHYEMMMGANN